MNNGYDTLSNSILLKASQANLDFVKNTKQDLINYSTPIECGILKANSTIIRVENEDGQYSCEIGSQYSVLKIFNGDMIDCYNRNSGDGRILNLNYLNSRGVRIGDSNGKLSINCIPNSYEFQCQGSGKFSGSLSCNNLVQTSDQRIKTNVQNISEMECLRLIKTVHPKTYNRIDMDSAPRIGYIAQDLDRELTDNYRCIMGSSEDANGTLLALDYSRMVVILHGALLNALNRIEVLESKQ